jgi:hypothetical protein
LEAAHQVGRVHLVDDDVDLDRASDGYLPASLHTGDEAVRRVPGLVHVDGYAVDGLWDRVEHTVGRLGNWGAIPGQHRKGKHDECRHAGEDTRKNYRRELCSTPHDIPPSDRL